MRLERLPRRKPVGITSLIDVIFLLLLFFMLASSFTRYQALPVTSGVSGAGEGERPMLLRVHDAQRWDINGESVTPDELGERLTAIAAAAEGNKRQVAVWTGADASTQDVVDAMVAVRGAGLDAVVVTGR